MTSPTTTTRVVVVVDAIAVARRRTRSTRAGLGSVPVVPVVPVGRRPRAGSTPPLVHRSRLKNTIGPTRSDVFVYVL